VVFVKSFEKNCFSVHFGSSAGSLTSTLNVQKSEKSIIFEYKKGLNIIRRGLKNTSQDFIDLWESCSQTFIRWVELQLAYNQHFKKIIG